MVPDIVVSYTSVVWSVERCAPGVKRQIHYTTDDGYCFAAVVVCRPAEFTVANDINDAFAEMRLVVSSNLDKVLIADNDREVYLLLTMTEVIAGCDDVAWCGIANVLIIDDHYGIEATAA